ncbi:MAG: class I SAM-dependent methyltransferase [Patescibacteria group bacterium]|nr:class I SAM-dependent methyltransferase [Patescibacteria group bacterium]
MKNTNTTFDRLVEILHAGNNPYLEFSKQHWAKTFPADQFNGWGSQHPWLSSLVVEIRPRLIIEVGSFLGGSAIEFATALRACGLEDSAVLCVDTWLAEEVLWSLPEWRARLKIQCGTPCCYYTFLANIIEKKLHDTVLPLRMPSLSAARYLGQSGAIRAQLIYIDGSHVEGDVLRDMEHYWPLLDAGGVLLMDDYGFDPDRFAGLMRDVQRFSRQTGIPFSASGDKALFRKPA